MSAEKNSNAIIEANTMNLDQTAPKGVVSSGFIGYLSTSANKKADGICHDWWEKG